MSVMRRPRNRALSMLRALAGHPEGLTTRDLAVACASDVPLSRRALRMVRDAMRRQEKSGRVRCAGTVASPATRQHVIRWEITEAGTDLISSPARARAEREPARLSKEQQEIALTERVIRAVALMEEGIRELEQVDREIAALGPPPRLYR